MCLKRISISLIIFIFLISGACMAKQSDALLVIDMRNASELPKNFRTTSDSLPSDQTFNTQGFSDLHIAGSGQFSKLSLKKVKERLNTKHLTVIDLRQESHGFLNGNAISWYASENAANAGLSASAIEQTQTELLGELNQEAEASVHKILTKTKNDAISKTKPIDFSVHGVTSEAELAGPLQFHYRRLYVRDHHAPTIYQVDQFIKLVKNTSPEDWIYVHCRAGVGRSTMFMVIYDIMRNAKTVSFDDIIARQAAIGGKNLSELPESNSYKYNFLKKRLELLKQFYQYAKTNQDHFMSSFEKWLQN